jgi:hypothetical protein
MIPIPAPIIRIGTSAPKTSVTTSGQTFDLNITYQHITAAHAISDQPTGFQFIVNPSGEFHAA